MAPRLYVVVKLDEATGEIVDVMTFVNEQDAGEEMDKPEKNPHVHKTVWKTPIK